MTQSQIEKAREEKHQTKNLDELKGINFKIAEKNLEYHGCYFCNLDGIKTEVVY